MYAIIREKRFESQLKKISETYKRMAILDEAIDWALSRNPADAVSFTALGEVFFLWVMDESPVRDIPQVQIFYHVDVNIMQVTLYEIQVM